MAHPQYLLLGYFDRSTLGRFENRPQPDTVRNAAFLVAAKEFFAPLMDLRTYVIPEDADLCPCNLLQECNLCRQPSINERGLLEVFLWKINGKFDLTSMILAFTGSTECEIVRISGFRSYLCNFESMSRDLHYYSGQGFRSVIDDWQRVASQNAADRQEFEAM